jgi:hypothetical protein
MISTTPLVHMAIHQLFQVKIEIRNFMPLYSHRINPCLYFSSREGANAPALSHKAGLKVCVWLLGALEI